LKAGKYMIKELNTNIQHEVSADNLIPFVKDLAQKNPILLPKDKIKGGEE
jgi:hypothetical protein